MAVIDQISKLGEIIISGQWGDVLFDMPKLSKKENLDNQTRFVFDKIVKPGGLLLSNKLWDVWGFNGKFEKVLFDRIKELLLEIKIENPSRRVQTFKSIHWANRWANPNLKFIQRVVSYSHLTMKMRFVNLFAQLQMNIYVIEKFK